MLMHTVVIKEAGAGAIVLCSKKFNCLCVRITIYLQYTKVKDIFLKHAQCSVSYQYSTRYMYNNTIRELTGEVFQGLESLEVL